MIFALLACLVACIAVQMLAVAVICGHGAIADEAVGRRLLAARDECLVELKEKANGEWGPTEMSEIESGQTTLGTSLLADESGWGWTLTARVSDLPEGSLTTSALVERGRDGLDLPRAAMVSDRAVVASGRTTAWLMATGGSGLAFCRVLLADATPGQEALVCSLQSEWTLGEGWRAFLLQAETVGDDSIVFTGEEGEIVMAPKEMNTGSEEDPILVVVLGGASLDLSNLEEIWGVVVVDEGSVCLEGTVVHGGVYVTKDVELGVSGQIVYEESVVQWARDRSLTRTRLVPGSRREVTD